VKSAPLQERNQYGSALPFRVDVCDEAPVLAHSCAGKPGGASGGTLLIQVQGPALSLALPVPIISEWLVRGAHRCSS